MGSWPEEVEGELHRMAWLSCILVALTVVASTQGYTCPAGASEEEFDIGRGDSEVFKTQAKKKYGPNVNCTVTYNRDAQTCRQLKFACNKFKMGRKDFLYVKKGKRTLRFGGKRFKAQVFNGDTSVRFVSNKKKHGPGAICRATCNKAVPPPATTTTSAPPSNETTRVKGYIDAGTCGTISFGEFDTSVCGDAASSYYKEFTYNGKRVIISNNIPDHAAEHDMLNANPNLRSPGWQFISMPINPGKGSSITDTGLGTIGLAVTGGVFFNDLSNPDGSLAMANEGTSLDSCLGHSAPTGSNGGGGGPPPGG